MTLQRRVEEAPEDTAALLALAHFRQDGHQLEEAADAYERLLALVPDHRQAHLDLALVYAEAGRLDDARRVTRALLARHPEDPAGRYNLGARRLWTEVAAQSRDAGLAAQARSSLAQLDALASGASPPPSSGPAPAPPAASSGPSAPLPAGHPPLPSFEPVLVED